MSAIANSSAKVIWLVEHYADSTCLFELENLYFRLAELLEVEPIIEQLRSMPEMTFIFSEIAPNF